MMSSPSDGLITALDHIVLLCSDFERDVDTYSHIMGFSPDWVAEGDGQKTATFQMGNTALELLAPLGDGGRAKRIKDLMDNGVRLATLAYRTQQVEEAHRLLGRRGLSPSELSAQKSEDIRTGQIRAWTRFRLDTSAMAGISSFVLEPTRVPAVADRAKGSVKELDHLVIQTPNPERAVATYGGRLGLRLALDRTETRWDTRFLFFRLGGLTIEIIQRLSERRPSADPDHLWGLTWGTDNLEICHDRLKKTGADISDIRRGRKPGTRIFTLRDRNLGVPTLFIEQGSR